MRIRFDKRTVKIVAVVCFAVIFFLAIYFLMQHIEDSSNRIPAVSTITASGTKLSDTITWNGIEYVRKEHISTMLLLGIDKTGKMESNGSYINDQQSDFIVVIVLDETTNTYDVIQIDRDTMSEVQRLGLGGAVVDKYVMQLALAHTYGDGMEDSCENSVEAVESFLGVDIDHYLAMNMSAVETMVDTVGGITVTIMDDFSDVDESLIEGETMTLTGSQCVTYVRSRWGVGDETNITRSARQRDFIYQLLTQMHEKKDLGLQGLVSTADYIVTDLSANRLNSMVEQICDAECNGIVYPDGEAVLGEEFMEFYADEDSVREIVMSLFYEPTEG